MTPQVPKVRIYHNNLWARYKGLIFSKIHLLADPNVLDVRFIQVAETSRQRAMLGAVDRSFHQYPYELLFQGSDDDISDLRLTLALIVDLCKHRCELVVIPGYHRVEYWAMLFACMLLGRKRAVFCDSTAYDSEKVSWKEQAKAFFFRRCQAVFCYGTRSKEYVSGYGVEAGRIFAGCQAAALPQSYSAAAVLRHYGDHGPAPLNASRFLFVGRLSEEKGLSDLLSAFQAIRAQLTEAKLDVVGSGVLADGLPQRARALGLAESVAFLGTRTPEEIGQFLMNSAALVLPSHKEPWGLVVNEALSYGCPVVASSICGCVPELVHDSVTGFVFPVGNVDELGRAMLRAAELSVRRRAVAEACIEVVKQYTPGRAAAQILRGCVSILNTPQ